MTAVGIDVGKAAPDVAISEAAGVSRFAYSSTGIHKRMKRLQSVDEPRIAK